MKKRVAPSAALEAAIDELLSEGLGDAEQLAEMGRLGARLVLQRALEEEVVEFLGRARYERTPEARGSRNGLRPRRVQTAEGELEVQMPQLRETADRFVSKILPDVRRVVRTRPLEALIIGAYVCGLSDRDIESLTGAEVGEHARGLHARIMFRPTPTGRQACIEGRRVYVWRVMETVWASDGKVEEAADYLGLTADQVRSAVRYCAEYRDEIEGQIRANEDAAARERRLWESTQEALRR